jgi:hypothetical protein
MSIWSAREFFSPPGVHVLEDAGETVVRGHRGNAAELLATNC